MRALLIQKDVKLRVHRAKCQTGLRALLTQKDVKLLQTFDYEVSV